MKLKALAIAAFLCVTHTAEARPRAWCGWYLAGYYNYTGKLARELWLGLNWLHKFERAPLAPGMVAIFRRKGGTHVGEIRDTRPGKVLLHSGNDGRAVRTRWRSTRGLIATVNPRMLKHAKQDHKPNRKARLAGIPRQSSNGLPPVAPVY